jgi:hypothetical protein
MPVAPHPDVTENRKEMDMAEHHDGSDRCIVEVDGSAAGILLREEDGAYQFFAANPGAALLEFVRRRNVPPCAEPDTTESRKMAVAVWSPRPSELVYRVSPALLSERIRSRL